MAMSPSSLLAKLDELKKWQQTQQERLLRQHQSRLEETEKGSSDYESIQGLSAYESFNKSNENKDDQFYNRFNPNKSNEQSYNRSSKDESETGNESKQFHNTLIDAQNQLYNTEITNVGELQFHSRTSETKRTLTGKQTNDLFEPTNTKPKQPFLKRGTGLEKFGMKAGDQKRPFNKMRPPQTAVHKRLAALRREEAMKKRINQEVPSNDMQNKVVNDQQKNKHVRFVRNNNHDVNKHNIDNKANSHDVKKPNIVRPVGKNIKDNTPEVHARFSDKNLNDGFEVNKVNPVRHADTNLINVACEVNPVRLVDENISNEQNTVQITDLRDEVVNQNSVKLVDKILTDDDYDVNGHNLRTENHDSNQHNFVKLAENGNNLDPSYYQNIHAIQNSSPRHLYPIQEELSRTDDDTSNIEQAHCRFNFQGQSKINMDEIKGKPRIAEDNPITPLKVPEISVQPKAKWFSVDNNNELSIIPDNSFPSIEVNADLMNCLKQLAAEKFGNAPNETAEQSTQDILKEIEELTSGRLKPDESIYGTPDLHRKLVECLQELARNCTDGNSCVSLQSCDTSAQRELHIFEQLEQKVLNSSFCSTNSSILELLSSTPFKKAVQEQKTVHFEEKRRDSLAKRELDFNPPSDESTINSDDLEERTLAEQQDWPNFEESTGTSSTSTQSLPARNVIIKQNACVMTDDLDFSELRISDSEEALKKRLKELDKEISNFRAENTKLQKMKSDVENERKELQRSRKKLEKELQDERIRMEFEVEEERKKLSKEKMVFERYVKDLQNKPTKKEREEISTLKAELANVKETLKLKETRNGTTQARLRNQLKTLEKENANLKEEVEKLQKQNAKLTASQKVIRKPSETKMLHEINKNLTKLTQDAKVVKQINQAERSIEKLDDSMVMLEEKRRRRKKSDSYETEYRRSYGHCSDSDEESDESMKYSRREPRRKLVQSPNNRKSTSPEGAKTYFSKSSRRKSEYSPKEKQTSRKTFDDRSSYSPLHDIKTKDTSPLISEKENDKNSTNCDMTTFRNLSDLSIENNYDKVFGQNGDKTRNSSLNDTQGSTSGKVESILEDGSKETKYVNGNVKIVSADGNFIRMKYYNGDIKETKLLDGSIKYYYAQSEMWQTTLSNGDEILEFPDGQTEKRYGDGITEVTFPNGVVKLTHKDGKEKISYPDGSVVTVNGEEKILLLPNGQKEIHTKEHKRREYPDGTVKILYPDGLQETRYSNGRIRMKDKDGNLLMDTHSDDL